MHLRNVRRTITGGIVIMLRTLAGAVLSSGFLFSWTLLPARAVTNEWTRQLGTDLDDGSRSVSADGLGNVYISGYTTGSLDGRHVFPGDTEVFVSKYNAPGSVQWTRQLGSAENTFDTSYSVSADGLGNVYVSGYTNGSLGGPNAGGSDAFVAKYDAAGNLQWTRKLGTNAFDYAVGVSADGLGNVYISGYTGGSLGGTNAGGNDAFVAKYDAAGSLQWSRQWGTGSDDWGWRVSADGLGSVYISGYTTGSLGGTNAGGIDAFVSKYDAVGDLQWTRQLGTGSDDASWFVSADGVGNVYISGYTSGSLGGTNAGGNDAFVAKYDAAGDLQWTRQLGTSTDDASEGVSADGRGSVYISGGTHGSLGGANAGGNDAFVAKYDAAGNLHWTRQLGTSSNDSSFGVSADGLGNVYISGGTGGSLGGTNAGHGDAFVAKFSEVTAGDYNGNGVVDAADYVVWRKGLATGTYTQTDYNTWRLNFGATAAGAAVVGPSSQESVPEPLPLSPIAIALLLVSSSNRLRR